MSPEIEQSDFARVLERGQAMEIALEVCREIDRPFGFEPGRVNLRRVTGPHDKVAIDDVERGDPVFEGLPDARSSPVAVMDDDSPVVIPGDHVTVPLNRDR